MMRTRRVLTDTSSGTYLIAGSYFARRYLLHMHAGAAAGLRRGWHDSHSVCVRVCADAADGCKTMTGWACGEVECCVHGAP